MPFQLVSPNRLRQLRNCGAHSRCRLSAAAYGPCTRTLARALALKPLLSATRLLNVTTLPGTTVAAKCGGIVSITSAVGASVPTLHTNPSPGEQVVVNWS